ncbi:E3 ubiquitin-protein ligase TRIM38-like [Sorex fumeus]|uniref:E3 ubiquitin-protein ligase TRIM38-like n=1 Tax=Sorex fumeus TaxID=62283 RepID=UPI0024ACE032|nr:E3 ubiquitin-protein ligase TRIM38-like [Sorex fumeus]
MGSKYYVLLRDQVGLKNISRKAMASAIFIKKLREEATCPICLELMTEPVSIDCGHSYCHQCIVGFTGNQSSDTSSPGTFHCPQCCKPFQSGSLRPNKQLRSMIQTFKEMNQSMCNEHGEQLHLFCENDGQLLCWCCERSPQHKGHFTATVEDACPGYQEKLQKAVTKLKFKESIYMQLKLDTTQKISSWEKKIKHEEERIHSEFTNLHTFLHQEEEFYMHRLEKEKEQKLSRLQDNVAYMDNKVEELKNGILELDKKCQCSARNFLQGIKDTLSRVSAINLETPEDVSLELHTVHSVSELQLSVRKILKCHQVNVSPDPDTRNQKLLIRLNEEKTTIYPRYLMESQTSERWNDIICMQGHERFTSGRHYFEVEMGAGAEGAVGVCLENAPRDIDIVREPQSGFWAIRQRKGKGCSALTFPPTFIPLRNQPEVIGIFLDCEAGIISFYNATLGSHIYTFTKASFSHALRPYFEAYSCFSLLQTS